MKIAAPKTTYELNKTSFVGMKEKFPKEFNWENPMQSPRLSNVVVSTGIGSLKDKKKIELCQMIRVEIFVA